MLAQQIATQRDYSRASVMAPWGWKCAGNQAGSVDGDPAGESGGFYVAPDGGAWPRCYLKPTKKATPGTERAAREKLASDLAYDLGLHVPAVLLTKRPDAPANEEQHVCLSAVQYPHQWSWSQISEYIQFAPNSPVTEKATLSMKATASIAWVFDTWVAQREHDEHPHNIIWGLETSLVAHGFVFLDYATSFGFGGQWASGGWRNIEPARIPGMMQAAVERCRVEAHLDALEALSDSAIEEIVARIPEDFLAVEQRSVIAEGLIGRRSMVRRAIEPYLNH